MLERFVEACLEWSLIQCSLFIVLLMFKRIMKYINSTIPNAYNHFDCD